MGNPNVKLRISNPPCARLAHPVRRKHSPVPASHSSQSRRVRVRTRAVTKTNVNAVADWRAMTRPVWPGRPARECGVQSGAGLNQSRSASVAGTNRSLCGDSVLARRRVTPWSGGESSHAKSVVGLQASACASHWPASGHQSGTRPALFPEQAEAWTPATLRGRRCDSIGLP
jgi:hypothetical protein